MFKNTLQIIEGKKKVNMFSHTTKQKLCFKTENCPNQEWKDFETNKQGEERNETLILVNKNQQQ